MHYHATMKLIPATKPTPSALTTPKGQPVKVESVKQMSVGCSAALLVSRARVNSYR